MALSEEARQAIRLQVGGVALWYDTVGPVVAVAKLRALAAS